MARTAGDALFRWLDDRAKRADDLYAIEEALLAGRFTRYVLRRLGAFVLARSWSAALHVVELTWLAHVFWAKPFVASLALQNGSLVVDAAFFGALEGMRRRIREVGRDQEATNLTTRWLTLSTWLAIAVIAIPIVQAVVTWRQTSQAPTLLHSYALVCFVRLGIDLVLRTYYSGVFAYQRVYRPLWFPMIAPAVLIGTTLLTWSWLHELAFVPALLLSTIASRAVLFRYTVHAYVVQRVARPRWRLRIDLAGIGARQIRDAVLGAVANTSTRIGGVVLIAAVMPSLASPEAFDEETAIEPFAYALHLAAPMFLIASQWAFVFYHDWKRIEREHAAALGRHLHRRLLATAAVVGVLSWAATVALTLFWVPWEESNGTLLALFPSMLGMSFWAATQLREFSRGEFVRQATGAAAMTLVVWFALSAEWIGSATWYLSLAAGPWTAILLSFVASRIVFSRAHGELDTLASWVRAAKRSRGEITAWIARVDAKPALLAHRIAVALGDDGAVARSGDRVAWFERGSPRSRDEWLARGAGMIVSLDGVTADGKTAIARLEEAKLLVRPEGADLDAIIRKHALLFPDGFVIRVGHRPPPSFLSLPPVTRQAIWRDALRATGNGRTRSGWFVTAHAPDGSAEVIFAAKRPVKADAASDWRRTTAPFGWRLHSAKS